MSEPASPTPTPLLDARPVDASERVTLLDALRGFALWGVFVSNSIMWFSGRTLMSRDNALALDASLLETVLKRAYDFTINQKFMTLFTFLFGLGFYIQFARAEARGSSILRLYSRRLLVLLGMGAFHHYAIWCGDVLETYAMLGFALLLFRNSSNRTVVLWAVVLLGVVPLLIPWLMRAVPIWLHGAEAAAEAAKARQALMAAGRTQLLEALSSDSFWTSLVGTARFNIDSYFSINRVTWMCSVLGRFLLGLLAGRVLLLQDLERNRGVHQRMVFWGLFLGVIGSSSMLVIAQLRRLELLDASSSQWMWTLGSIGELACLALAAAYVGLFALLSRRAWWQWVCNLLMPVGRMALTNYLMQSVMSVFIYNGWGLGFIAKLPISRVTLLCVGLFAGQMVFSRWWLSRFRFGPAEWLWRSLTYGRAQPMRLAPKPEEAGVAPA
ncbi:hypothetical protein MYSTI_06043 [Myxococcus stipitatus DSM 14675]|uniref:DUF418 domain-containing protein n=1 Tax=Myxococcus stipitatus (strain DSM 14675 / JCM 12634 / Mx s8) TaxID=1278073 RepID=L7UEG6_MYXSD|nr:DUF418 domain-containing protein [Myxococcus stipitatus]AGC47316.1 hypothetical protein MYSTI_06043 [Myxococcus stipitatus DSM 14675]